MSVLVIAFVFLVLNSCHMQENVDGYLSKDQSRLIKAILAIIVLFHHLANYYEADSVISFFAPLGYIAVGCFFFFSAYGLVVQFQAKREQYVKSFIGNKIKNIIIPYFIVSVIYWGYYAFRSGSIASITDIFWKPFTIYHLASNCWYIVALIYYYIVFFAAAWLAVKTKCNDKWILLLGTLAYTAAYYGYYQYFAITHETPLGLQWIYSILAIPFGVVWALYENKLKGKLRPLSLFAFIILILIVLYEDYSGHLWNIYYHNIKTICFIILLLFISSRVVIKSRALSFIGGISFELYMLHGLIIRILIDYGIRDANLNEFGILTVVIALAAAALFGTVYNKFKAKLNALTQKTAFHKNFI